MNEKLEKPNSDPENNESKEREARKKLGEIALNNSFFVDNEEDAPYTTRMNEYYNTISKLNEEENKQLEDSLWSYHDLKNKYEPLDRDFKFEYAKKWDEIRKLLLPTIAVPEQNPSKIDKHTRDLASALTSAIINLEIPEEKIKRMSGILTSEHLPDFAKQMSIFQLIHPIEDLDLEFKDSGLFKLDQLKSTSSHWNGARLDSPVLTELVQNQRANRNDNNNSFKEGKIEANNGREYTIEEVIYYDVLKCAFGSNGSSIKEFLKELEKGDNLINRIKDSDDSSVVKDHFSKEQIQQLVDYTETLRSLYLSQMQVGRKEEELRIINLPGIEEIMDSPINSIKGEISEIEELFGVNSRYSLGDRIVRSFCHPLGITGINSAREYLQKKQEEATSRNIGPEGNGEIDKLTERFIFKGVDNADYLPDILENGILSKDYLGVGAVGDMTPLDADFCTAGGPIRDYILEEILEFYENNPSEDRQIDPFLMDFNNKDFVSAIEHSIALAFSGYREKNGFILATKRDDRFQDERQEGSDKAVYDKDRYGIFEADAYGYETPRSSALGVRTGIAASDIDYIIAHENSAGRIIEHIKKNSFYIPVVDTKGNLILPYATWQAEHE